MLFFLTILKNLTLDKLNKVLPSYNDLEKNQVMFQSSSETKKTITDQFISLYINTLPETSFARSLQPRKGNPGYNTDVLEAFRTKGFDLGISHIFDERFPDGYIRLPLGGFINHHEIPNCKALIADEDKEMRKIRHIRIEALQPISNGQEITIKYIINKLDDPNWEFEYEISQ